MRRIASPQAQVVCVLVLQCRTRGWEDEEWDPYPDEHNLNTNVRGAGAARRNEGAAGRRGKAAAAAAAVRAAVLGGEEGGDGAAGSDSGRAAFA
eukprot:COSAG06_NODE_3712_length_4986_cov_54.729691_2_plen_94_part_00